MDQQIAQMIFMWWLIATAFGKSVALVVWSFRTTTRPIFFSRAR